MKQKQYSESIVTLLKCMAPILAMVSGVAHSTSIDFSKLSNEQVREALEVKIRTVRHMALNPVVVNAVKDQNNKNTEALIIKRRGVAWKKSAVTNALKQEIDGNNASAFLKRKVTSSTEFSRALLTDNNGANVANYPSARSYTHSKTDSWSKSWNDGDGVIYLSKPLLDKRMGSHSVQISAPVQDRGVTIGVLMVDVDIENYGARTGDAKAASKKPAKAKANANPAQKDAKAVKQEQKNAEPEKVQPESVKPEEVNSVEVGSTEQTIQEATLEQVGPDNIASETTN